MGKYSVPENIRKFKPKGTMVKLISGNYYVYEYKMIKGDDGKRHTKMGSLIGTIKEGIGFIPNNSFVCDAEISTLDYGDYAITVVNSKNVFSTLDKGSQFYDIDRELRETREQLDLINNFFIITPFIFCLHILKIFVIYMK